MNQENLQEKIRSQYKHTTSFFFGLMLALFDAMSILISTGFGFFIVNAISPHTIWLRAFIKYIENNHTQGLSHCLKEAATEFKKICINKVTHKVGIVGEIFLKFHFYAQRHITEWLVEKNIEVEPPLLTPFFLQAFVNIDVNHHTQVERSTMAKWIRDSIYRLIRHRIHKYDKICSVFSYYTPFDDIYDIAEKGKDIVSLNAQFGEGWLLPGEVATMAGHGIKHVVSLQPFGCIANHIISKGIEKRLKACFPDVKFLSLDFDSGVSDVNVVNRMLLFVNDLLTSSPKP